MGLKSSAVDALIEHVVAAENKSDLKVAVKALDRTLRAYNFWIPQWYNDHIAWLTGICMNIQKKLHLTTWDT